MPPPDARWFLRRGLFTRLEHYRLDCALRPPRGTTYLLTPPRAARLMLPAGHTYSSALYPFLFSPRYAAYADTVTPTAYTAHAIRSGSLPTPPANPFGMTDYWFSDTARTRLVAAHLSILAVRRTPSSALAH